MDCSDETRRYCSVYNPLRIGNKEYPVINLEVAAQRAQLHLDEALKLLATDLDKDIHKVVNEELLIAADFGSKEAPFILALRVLDSKNHVNFPPREAVAFLKVASERGHAEAAYRLACCYAGVGKFKLLESAAANYLANFSLAERRRLAIYYFEQAVAQQHRPAIEEIIMAYSYGRGIIEQDVNQLAFLCEQLTEKDYYPAMLGYAAWLVGMTVLGEEPLASAVSLPRNQEKSLQLLLRIAKSDNLQLAQHALFLICRGFERDAWRMPVGLLVNRLFNEAMQGNQLLALYLAWYCVPAGNRSLMPKLFEKYQLQKLADVVESSEKQALVLLNLVILGKDDDIASAGNEILSQVFGKCFLGEDGCINMVQLNDIVASS